MINEIHYKNFKALRDATLSLGRFTLIVGANGTGKTTAIKTLEIVKNYENFSWKDLISIDFFDEEQRSVVLEIHAEDISREITWQVGKNGEELTLPDNFNSHVGKRFHEAKMKLLNDFRVFTFNADKIAEPTTLKPNIKLDSDGENLAGVLWQIQSSEPEVFDELNSELQKWFPEFNRIIFEIPENGKVSFLLRTTVGKHKIKAVDLSDGTRLALAYLTIAYLPSPPSIVAFEEPEKGIHPRLLRNIQEAMYRLAYPENYGEERKPIQVIVTTHSPYLLDLYKDYPEEIIIASKDEKGVHFERLIDKPHYEEVLQDAPLGEIWYSGVLGGVPAQL
ncbi:MAG: AAA family ATPase [Pyrinomonadaceae bacterium]